MNDIVHGLPANVAVTAGSFSLVHPVVQVDPTAVIAARAPQLAADVLRAALGASIANTAMVCGATPSNLSGIEVKTKTSIFGTTRSIVVNFRR